MTVHSILPEALARGVVAGLETAGIRHTGHGTADPVGSGQAAVSDPEAPL
jgi:hypothetical protein